MDIGAAAAYSFLTTPKTVLSGASPPIVYDLETQRKGP